MTIKESHFDSIELAARALSGQLAEVLRNAINQRGQAVLAVSGGRTPQMVFEHLQKEHVDWRKVIITLSDERWVAADHVDSNENLTRRYLLQGNAAAARFLPLYGGEETPQIGQPECEQRLKNLSQNIDAIYLGMGEDGHFASLFPASPALEVTDSLCVAVDVPDREPRVARITLSSSAIINSENIYLLFSGNLKMEKYQRAKTPGSASELPLRLLLRNDRTKINVLIID